MRRLHWLLSCFTILACAVAEHAVFLSVPYIGHLQPLVVQALELASRGWRTSVVSCGSVENTVIRRAQTLIDGGSFGSGIRLKASAASLSNLSATDHSGSFEFWSLGDCNDAKAKQAHVAAGEMESFIESSRLFGRLALDLHQPMYQGALHRFSQGLQSCVVSSKSNSCAQSKQCTSIWLTFSLSTTLRSLLAKTLPQDSTCR